MRWLTLFAALAAAGCNTTGPDSERSYTLSFDAVEVIYEASIPVGTAMPIVAHPVFTDTLPSYDISWSPDGSRVAFTRQYTNPDAYRVIVYDTRTGVQEPLTHGPEASFQPAWSPDGTRIAYLSRSGNAFDATLRVVQADGTNDRSLGPTPLFVRRPRWSPNSRVIAAVRPDLRLILIEGTTGDTIRTLGYGLNPDWSPDGQQLVFVLDTAIAFSDLHGHVSRTIHVPAFDVAWSPDGQWLAFDGGTRLGLLPALAMDTTDLRVVGPYSRPAWRRH